MRILLIDDDEHLCEVLKFQLESEGLIVDTCHDGDDGLRWIRENVHDIILLDRMLPVIDGMNILKKMRKDGYTQPVILLTALGEVSDRVLGLNYGADDYIVKPFAFEELMARINSIARRPRQWEAPKPIDFGDLSFNATQKMIFCNTKSCSLSKREAELFEMFIKNPGQVLPRTLLLSRVWGPDADVEDGNLDNYIHFIRRRMKAVGSHMTLKTVRGIGYQLEE